MKKLLIFISVLAMLWGRPEAAYPAASQNPLSVQTLDNNITATVYSFKKTRHYTAVEIGFNNPTDGYLEFTPQEIYLDDEVKYSLAPLSVEQIQSIEEKNPGIGIVPGVLAIGLGVASLGTAIGGKSGVARGLGIAALSAGGAYAITKGVENHAKQNRLITFENNSITGIKRLPPGMTLGGYLYFPKTKKPRSVTIVAKSKNGKFERKVFELGEVKLSQKEKNRLR